MSIYDETYQQFLTESNASLLAEREQELSRQYMEAMQGSDAGSMSLDDYDVAAVADAKLPQGVLSPRFLYNGRQVIGDYDAGSGERVLPPEEVPVNAPSWWENTRGYLMDQAKEAFGLVGASAYNTAATRDDIIRRTLDTTADLAAAFGVPEDELVRGGQPMPETQSTALNIARDLTGYGVQFAGALGALRGTLGAASTGLGAATQTAAGAAAADFMMDPRTDSLIDAVANLFGMESALVDRINPATIYEQSPVMGRVALAGEGLAVGGLVDAAYRGIKRIAQNADEIERIGVERMRRSTHQLNQGIDPEGLRGMVEYFTGKALKGFDTLTPELRQEVSATGATAEQVEAAFEQAIKITDMAEQRAVEAWHGSPHKYDQPSLHAVGTGEGAQAYGYGYYSAQSPDVARVYAPRNFEYEDKIMSLYNDAINREDYAAAEVYERAAMHDTPDEIKEWMPMEIEDSGQTALANVENLYQQQQASFTYKLRIPKSDVDQYIDYDAPLSEQPDILKKLRKAVADVPALSEALQSFELESTTGGTIQRLLAREIMSGGGDNVFAKIGVDPYTELADMDGNQVASLYLDYLGIPGIKYFDQGSRSIGEGTRNFVTFDPNRIQVISRNGKELRKNEKKRAEVLAALGASGAAMQVFDDGDTL